MGQDNYSNIKNAENEVWGNLYLTGFPIVELRPLYKLVLKLVMVILMDIKPD